MLKSGLKAWAFSPEGKLRKSCFYLPAPLKKTEAFFIFAARHS